ncbi:hypothetical protein ABZS81_29275 [Streptomyces sp. NPDC005318]|uniref:hypothetical protein n=1 Tax=Streptomyces sp. NPDC005318 TaxID=3157031 RepID=UPI0033BFB714
MAEEQHEWLDEDAAERLLRGEPVDPVDGQARTEAERLVAALGAVARSARPATGELPGEAAALAAFRGVPRGGRAGERAALPTPGRPTGHVTQSSGPEQREHLGPSDRAEHLQLPEPQGQSGPSGHPELSQALGPIRIGAAPSTTASSSAASGGRTRTPRWSRPVRFGLVASLAGCALGGVAVAAGTGMLLGPFGGHANPLPGSSVSAPASPEERLDSDGTSAAPSGSPVPHPSRDSAGPSTATGDGTRKADSARGKGGLGRDGRNSSDTDSDRDTAGEGRGVPYGTGSTAGSEQDGTYGIWGKRTVRACRDYRAGRLDADRRRRLEVLAKGAGGLDRFCRRVLQTVDGPSGDAQQGSGDEPQSEDGGSGGGTGDEPSRTVPSLWSKPAGYAPSAPGFRPAPGTTAVTR